MYMMSSYYYVLGVSVPSDVQQDIQTYLYNTAGVIDARSYFETGTRVDPQDPGGTASNKLLTNITNNFKYIYNRANFEDVSTVPVTDFDWMLLACEPRIKYRLKELFRSAACIQDTDTQTIHTAIFRSYTFPY